MTKATTHCSKIRFIGYTIPTTPAGVIPIGNPNGPGAVAGTYLGNLDWHTDALARIEVLKHAVNTAKAKLNGDTSRDVINLFVAPEFFFHGDQGPYVYAESAGDPVDTILKELAAAFPEKDYPNWTFLFGTAITAKIKKIEEVYQDDSTLVRNAVVKALAEQWLAAFGPLNGVVFDMLVNFIKNCHGYPCLEVRNRALIVSSIPLDGAAVPLNTRTMTTEKYFVSNEDFILYDVTGRTDVVTEQMTAYPMIDLSAGDLKQSAYDKYAIFRQNYGVTNIPAAMDFGVEICLDHSDVRLRRNIDNEPFPLPTDGIDVQVIPSCGMQINLASVAADTNGFVFNCDGQYPLDASVGTAKQGTLNGVLCIYANNVNPTNSNYAGHTQLARVANPAVGDNPNKKGASNATFQTLETTDIAILTVPEIPILSQYFAGGAGQVHIYGLDNPYTLYPAN